MSSFGFGRNRSMGGGSFGRTNTNNTNQAAGGFNNNNQGGGNRFSGGFNNNNQNQNNPNQNQGTGMSRFGNSRFGNNQNQGGFSGNRFSGGNQNQNQGGFNNSNNQNQPQGGFQSNQNQGTGMSRFGNSRFGNNQNQGGFSGNRFGGGNQNQNQGNNSGNTMGFNNNNNQNTNPNLNISGTGYPPFEFVREPDATIGAPPVFFATITAMSQYGNKSLEELRMEDMLTNRYGPGANQVAQQLAQSGNMNPTNSFGNTNSTTTTTSRFGSIGAGGGTSRFGFGANNANTNNATNTTSPSRFGFGNKFGSTGTNQGGTTTGGTGFGFGRTSSGGTGGFGFGRSSTGSTTGGTTGFGGSRFGSSSSTTGGSRFGFGANASNNQTTTGGTPTGSRFGFGRTSFGSTNSGGTGTGTGTTGSGFGFGFRRSGTGDSTTNNNVVHANITTNGTSGSTVEKKYSEFSADQHEKQTSEAFATLMANAARAAGVSESVISQLTSETSTQHAEAILSRAKAEAEEARRQAQAEKEANEARMESIRMQSRINSAEPPMRTGSGGVMRVRSAQPLTTMFSPVRTSSALATNAVLGTRTGTLANVGTVRTQSAMTGLPISSSSAPMLGTRTMSSSLDASLQLSALGTRTNSGLLGTSRMSTTGGGLPTRTASMMLTSYGKGSSPSSTAQRTISGRDLRLAIEKPVITHYEEISGVRVPSYTLVEPLLALSGKETMPPLNDDNHVRLRVVLSKDLETNYIATVSNNERQMYRSSAGTIPTLNELEQDEDMKLAVAALSAVDKVWIEVDPSVTSVDMLKHEVVEARIKKASEILEKLREESINAGIDTGNTGMDGSNGGTGSSPLRTEDKSLTLSRLSTSGSSVTGRSHQQKQEKLRNRCLNDENILRRLSSGIDKYFKLADNDSKTVLFEKSVVRNKLHENKLKDYNLADNKDIIALWYPEQQSSRPNGSSASDDDPNNDDGTNANDNYDGGNNGYYNQTTNNHSTHIHSYPSWDVLSTMDSRSRSQVPNFRVECNGMGAIEWLDPVDLNNVDIHNDIVFENGNVQVNNPQLLQKRAQVTLDNVWNDNSMTDDDFIGILEQHCQTMGSRFDSYNPETGQFSFIVDHF